MLDLDLDLEADLGVDTVKQAEVFASVREAYNIARDEKLRLRDFPTLKHVIQFVYDKRPDLKLATIPTASVQSPAPALEVPEATPATPQVAADPVKDRILAVVADKTGYPVDMLDLDLDLEADLGVDTVKQAEVFASVREAYNIARDEKLRLRDFPTLKHVIEFVYGKRPDLKPTAVPTPSPRPPALQVPEATPAAPQLAADPVKDRILAVVADKTGYPVDMLDLDLDLEADLGVDTVKQAEVFASVREAYGIARDENLRLRDFPTLKHVIQFVYAQRPDLKPAADLGVGVQGPGVGAAAVSVPTVPESTPAAPQSTIRPVTLRVPAPVLRPPLALCKPTGIALGPGSCVLVMSDKGGVGEALAQMLTARGVDVLRCDGAPDPGTLAGVHGVYWLPALDYEGDVKSMDLSAWRQALAVRLKSLYQTMRALYEQVAAAGTFLVSATRLGGMHGYDEAGAFAPLGGAVTGFTKTYKRERPEALVKAVDFAPENNASDIAAILIDETLTDPGAVEIGRKGNLRWTIGLQQQTAIDGQTGVALDRSTVFVVTGAAGSIVSAITADLASASGGAFYLLDMAPAPDPANPDLERFVRDKDGLKRELAERMKKRGERATPVLVERELATIERAQAAKAAIDAVRAAGGTAEYFSVNLTDPQGVARAIDEVRTRSGRIDVLLHAAGMERSHFLPEKDQREFDLVFDVKADGWFNLLHAIGNMPLRATVAFSSIAGRFGNGGQADYSAANDLLCKFASNFRTTRPETQAIAIDWTAWAGIGMASRGSIPKMMEMAGIDMLPPESGIPVIRHELLAGTRDEIVVAERLGILTKEWDAHGGLASAPGEGPMLGNIARIGIHNGLVVETTLDPALQPFLHDHQIDGTPVLPGVMGIEAFAEAALSLLPGWHIEAIEDVNFLAPFKFYRNEPRTVTVEAVFHPEREGVTAECRLTGSRSIANQEPQITTHFTARVRLGQQTPESAKAVHPGEPKGPVVEAADIYKVYFHGPAYQVLQRAWLDGDRMMGEMAQRLPANHHPAEVPASAAPRLIELCFQTAGLWDMQMHGRMGLPQHIGRVLLGRAPDSIETPVLCTVSAESDGGFSAVVTDGNGNTCVRLSGYRMVELPGAVDLGPLKPMHAVPA
jgi:NAD(P)-dependent dehydrogenase (short-subunit alcohol dehydrogenase family)/acyl carrier protein